MNFKSYLGRPMVPWYGQ